MRPKVYIIGSMAWNLKISQVGFYIREHMPELDVDWVHLALDGTTREELISQCFSNIECADVVVALEKPDGTFGESVLNEMEYARRCKKIVLTTRSEDRYWLAHRISMALKQKREDEVNHDIS